MSKIIGIDLGTTNSVVAVMEGTEPVVIPTPEGARTMPSVVAFKEDGEILVGAPAKRQAIINPKRTIASVKRFMGRRFSEVQEEAKRVPYEVVEGKNGMAMIKIDDKLYTPQEISAMILQKLKQTAEDYLGEKVTEAVITVPAYFNDAQRKATQEAGQIAGLKVRRIINEPTAASLAYGLDRKGKEEKISVYDLGGGTYDISVLEIGDGVFEVKATSGDTHLGGDDFDQRLIDYIADEFQKQEGIDLRKDPMALQRLKEAAEKAKIELSSTTQTTINLPFITATQEGPKHLNMEITRSKFEQLIEDLVQRTVPPIDIALKDAGLSKSEVDEAILVGGSTRIPRIQRLVEEYFNKKPNRTVNPDEVVALGAAIQGAVLSGDVSEVLLLDVTPLNLGIETLGGAMTVLIPANTTIPTRKCEIFSTASDNQTSVEIHVLQGNRPLAKDNRSLGKFYLDGIPPAPRGVPQIEVCFDIDADGILHVTAKDLATGKEQSIRIEGSSGLTPEEIERMRKEAQEHAAEDARKRELIDKLNTADTLVWQTTKNLEEYGDKLPPEKKAKIEAAVERLKQLYKELRENPDTSRIGELDLAIEQLNQAWQEASQELYAAQQAAGAEQQTPGAESTSTGGSTDGGVQDVDYEVVDEDDK